MTIKHSNYTISTTGYLFCGLSGGCQLVGLYPSLFLPFIGYCISVMNEICRRFVCSAFRGVWQAIMTLLNLSLDMVYVMLSDCFISLVIYALLVLIVISLFLVYKQLVTLTSMWICEFNERTLFIVIQKTAELKRAAVKGHVRPLQPMAQMPHVVS